MRGAGDALSVGERVAFYRQRRGLTQRRLAEMVDRSEDWLSKIERGERQLRQMDLLAEVARALRVTLGDLVGEPVLAEDQDEQHDDVPAIRDALMAPRRLSRVLYRAAADAPPPPLPWAKLHVESSWQDYQAGRVGRVIAALPQLIKLAQQLEDTAADVDEPRQAWAVSARVHHLAATTLSKLGEADLGWIAAERAMQAADQSDDPLVLASAARASTHALLATGRYDDAVDLGTTAAGWLRDQLAEANPEALSLLGMLYLRTAVAAARDRQRVVTNDLLEQASAAAEQLGHDANYWQTSFGPTNVALHRLSAALDLGDVSYVVAHEQDVDAGGLPVERQAVHAIEMARALSYVGEDDEALGRLLTAEQGAPTLVRQNATARETVKTLQRRAPVTGGRRSSALLALAERCRAVG